MVPFLSMLHIKIRTQDELTEESEEETPLERPQRTLMDLQNVENFCPRLKAPEHDDLYHKFLKGNLNVADLLKITKMNGKLLLTDALLTHLRALSSGVRRRDLENYQSLLISVRELLWYTVPPRG